MNKNFFTIFIISIFLSGCSNTVERLGRVGKAPDFQDIVIPTTEEDQEDIQYREEELTAQRAHMRKTNSLWQPGSMKFFRDNRAWRVGDIIRVRVQVNDTANLSSSMGQVRSGVDNSGVTSFFGKSKKFLPSGADPASLIAAAMNRNHSGSGNVTRQENVKTEVAAIVKKILPNGNLVIQGHQEIRVNFELIEVKVAGIIRARDIASDNSIRTNQMAEARVSYGGRGVVSDVQQPKAAAQLIDILNPF